MSAHKFIFIDQHGCIIHASTRKELVEKVGGGKVSIMYRDSDAGTIRVGYVVGNRWFYQYAPVVSPA